MTLDRLISQLGAQGITLVVDGDDLVVYHNHPLDPALLADLKEHKARLRFCGG